MKTTTRHQKGFAKWHGEDYLDVPTIEKKGMRALFATNKYWIDDNV